MKTMVTFFNAFGDTVISEDAFKACEGKEVPLLVNGMLMGNAFIQRVHSNAAGVFVTYTTNADMGVSLELPIEGVSVELENAGGFIECTCHHADYLTAVTCPLHTTQTKEALDTKRKICPYCKDDGFIDIAGPDKPPVIIECRSSYHTTKG